ncbi:Peroxisomal membrane protein LPX1 [Spathaspora sp. JA1]|nr:Peroxisomal membrane protein LPX1 [Spathaspora sp. JA1]
MLTPESSPYYEHKLCFANAASPRAPGSVVLPKPSTSIEDYQLQIGYRKYVTKTTIPDDAKRINFIFLHGNGMNKGIWHYHINQIYAKYASVPNMYIDTVLAPDHINMCDSGYVNAGKLGAICDWNDIAKDYVQLVKTQEKKSFLHPQAFNVIVAHSMGGFIALQVTASEPNLFHCSVLINPVCVSNPEADPGFVTYQKDWYNRGYVKLNYEVKQGEDWYNKVYDHFQNKSFYRGFQPTILKDMMEDEIPDGYKRNQYYPNVQLKHDGYQDYVSYYSQYQSIPEGYPSYERVKVPTRILSGEKDLSGKLIGKLRDERLKHAQLHELKGQYHNMHASSPDLILSLLDEFVVETYNKNEKLNDFTYLKKYGKNYKQIMFETRLKEFLGDIKFQSKL